ncbi:MAG: tripartite tricarboxylate transporter substrate binding protein [Betaproteobacteria bacterium]|nr:tripartite tricarboxylate transporter substrate binding protein [Betaproteobacteria bacterium]
MLARVIGQKLHKTWGQPIIVDNRPGAGGNIGADIAAKSAPDGYTLFMANTTTLATSMPLYPRLPYDAVRDFAPVGLVATSLLVMIVPASLPVASVRDLIALAKARPGKIHYASAGVGTQQHLAVELFKLRAGVNIVHVAYKGGAPAVAAVASGESQLGFTGVAVSLPLIKAGKLRAIAVSTPNRSTVFPGVPSVAESGLPGFDITPRFALLAPARTPTPVIAKLNAEVALVLKLPDVIERLSLIALESKPSTPEQLGAIFKQEIAFFAKLITDAGIQAE